MIGLFWLASDGMYGIVLPSSCLQDELFDVGVCPVAMNGAPSNMC